MTTSKALLLTAMLLGALTALACGGAAAQSTSTSGSSSGSGSSSPAANAYAAAYPAVKWGATVTATFPSSCEMTLHTTGQPDYTPNAWYLAPAMGNATVVAYTAQTHMALQVVPYSMIQASLTGVTTTLNICPSPAAGATATGLGAIGYLVSGTAMFNPFEMDASTAAVADNASYTFTDGSGTPQTAYFLDPCDSHSNGSTWHAHGNPACVTSQVDTANGPSHIIGIALDGYPIYGGRDIDGSVIATSQLDACNGITSPTPEFPSGAYHYVLPIGVATQYASINCYHGTVSQSALAQAKALYCNPKTMMRMAMTPAF